MNGNQSIHLKLIEAMNLCGLGLRRGTVEVKHFNPKWLEAFHYCNQLISPLLKDAKVEHIGSTAFPGSIAKPILDILIEHPIRSTFFRETQDLAVCGFTPKGEYGIPGRCFFTLYDNKKENDYAHIHAYPKGHPSIDGHIFFKKMMLENTELIKQYNALKSVLIVQGINRKDYPGAKAEWISSLLPGQDSKLHFAKMKPSQVKSVKSAFQEPHITKWIHGIGLQNVLDSIATYYNSPDGMEHWLGYKSGRPFIYLITSDVVKGEWQDIFFGDGPAITIDVFILDRNDLGKGLGTQAIREFIKQVFPHATDILIDPEVANAHAVHVYQKLGFQILREFIAPWHPVPHYQMHMRRTAK
jgi:GrpB-like predicted nucleotidyltransferase (UPF0157 family)/GNAT superfamily N-acetyltransferase